MKPAYPIPVTLAIPAPGATPCTRPADPNTNGIMIENPHPATPNPGIAQAASGIDNAHPSPTAATRPPVLTARCGPNRAVTQSPRNRMVAMAAENTE